MTLSKFYNLSKPISLICNRGMNNSTYCIGMLWGLNKIICGKGLVQCITCSKQSLNISHDDDETSEHFWLEEPFPKLDLRVVVRDYELSKLLQNNQLGSVSSFKQRPLFINCIQCIGLKKEELLLIVRVMKDDSPLPTFAWESRI